MRIARGIILILAAIMISATSLAQIRIIPKEKRDSVTNPATLKCNDMYFAAGRSLDFGTMEEDGGGHTLIAKWQNIGAEPLIITRIATSCGCVRCDYTREAVGSGKDSKISITYYPKGHPGIMRQRIFIYTNRSDQMPTAVVDLKGEVRASTDRRGDYPHPIGALLLRNRQIRIDSEVQQTIRIACMNGGEADLTPSKDNLLSSSAFSLTAEPKTLRAGQEGEIIISYTPTDGGIKEPLRLFINNKLLAPRDREIKIVTETKNR